MVGEKACLVGQERRWLGCAARAADVVAFEAGVCQYVLLLRPGTFVLTQCNVPTHAAKTDNPPQP